MPDLFELWCADSRDLTFGEWVEDYEAQRENTRKTLEQLDRRRSLFHPSYTPYSVRYPGLRQMFTDVDPFRI